MPKKHFTNKFLFTDHCDDTFGCVVRTKLGRACTNQGTNVIPIDVNGGGALVTRMSPLRISQIKVFLPLQGLNGNFSHITPMNTERLSQNLHG